MARNLALTIMLALACVCQVRSEETKVSDADLALRIAKKLKELKSNGELKTSEIEIEVDGGSVWLKGTVAEADELKRVLEVARRVGGVRRIINDLTTDPRSVQPDPIQAVPFHGVFPTYTVPFTPPRIDWTAYTWARNSPGEHLVQEIAQAIRRDSGKLGPCDIRVAFYEGILLLSGDVGNDAAHDAVIAAARGQANVKYVCDAIEVVDGEKEKLAHRVTTRLGTLDQFEPPVGARWLPNRAASNNTEGNKLIWTDGWWQLDFNATAKRN